jgi:hypothetical protein
LGLGEEQGKRYSWGYPAIPELEDHRKVFDLLPAVETELGMTLSPAYQLIPNSPPRRSSSITRMPSTTASASLRIILVEQLMICAVGLTHIAGCLFALSPSDEPARCFMGRFFSGTLTRAYYVFTGIALLCPINIFLHYVKRVGIESGSIPKV